MIRDALASAACSYLTCIARNCETPTPVQLWIRASRTRNLSQMSASDRRQLNLAWRAKENGRALVEQRQGPNANASLEALNNVWIQSQGLARFARNVRGRLQDAQDHCVTRRIVDAHASTAGFVQKCALSNRRHPPLSSAPTVRCP